MNITLFKYKNFSTITILIFCLFLTITSCKNKNGSSDLSSNDSIPAILADLNKKIDKSPKDGNLYIERANYYLSNDMINEALADVRIALLNDSSNYKYYLTLSDIYIKMGKIAAAGNALDRALTASPRNLDVILKQARFCLIIKNYNMVDEKTREAISIDKINPLAYFYRGWAAMESKDTLSAIKYFDLSLSQDPEFIDPYITMGQIYAIKGDPIAADYYRNALNVEPENNNIRYDLAQFLMNRGEIEKSIEQCNTIIVNDSTFAKAYFMLGYIDLNYTNDYISGIKNFSKVLKFDKNFSDAYYNRAMCNEGLQDYTSARKDYNSYLKFNNNDENAINALNRLDKLDR